MASRLEDYIAEGRTLDADEREIAALSLRQVDEARQAEVDAAWDRDHRPPAGGADERQGRGSQRPGDDRHRASTSSRTSQVTLGWRDHPGARAEFLDAYDHYADVDDGTLGDQFIDAVEFAAS